MSAAPESWLKSAVPESWLNVSGTSYFPLYFFNNPLVCACIFPRINPVQPSKYPFQPIAIWVHFQRSKWSVCWMIFPSLNTNWASILLCTFYSITQRWVRIFWNIVLCKWINCSRNCRKYHTSKTSQNWKWFIIKWFLWTYISTPKTGSNFLSLLLGICLLAIYTIFYWNWFNF